MSTAEFYSPVSFLRVLLKANRISPYTVLRMHKQDFLDFQTCAKRLRYSGVPYSRVTELRFTGEWAIVQFKTSSTQHDFCSTDVRNFEMKRRVSGTHGAVTPRICLGSPKVSGVKNGLSKEKVESIRSMLPWMPKQDRQYFSAILKLS